MGTVSNSQNISSDAAVRELMNSVHEESLSSQEVPATLEEQSSPEVLEPLPAAASDELLVGQDSASGGEVATDRGGRAQASGGEELASTAFPSEPCATQGPSEGSEIAQEETSCVAAEDLEQGVVEQPDAIMAEATGAEEQAVIASGEEPEDAATTGKGSAALDGPQAQGREVEQRQAACSAEATQLESPSEEADEVMADTSEGVPTPWTASEDPYTSDVDVQQDNACADMLAQRHLAAALPQVQPSDDPDNMQVCVGEQPAAVKTKLEAAVAAETAEAAASKAPVLQAAAAEAATPEAVALEGVAPEASASEAATQETAATEATATKAASFDVAAPVLEALQAAAPGAAALETAANDGSVQDSEIYSPAPAEGNEISEQEIVDEIDAMECQVPKECEHGESATIAEPSDVSGHAEPVRVSMDEQSADQPNAMECQVPEESEVSESIATGELVASEPSAPEPSASESAAPDLAVSEPLVSDSAPEPAAAATPAAAAAAAPAAAAEAITDEQEADQTNAMECQEPEEIEVSESKAMAEVVASESLAPEIAASEVAAPELLPSDSAREPAAAAAVAEAAPAAAAEAATADAVAASASAASAGAVSATAGQDVSMDVEAAEAQQMVTPVERAAAEAPPTAQAVETPEEAAEVQQDEHPRPGITRRDEATALFNHLDVDGNGILTASEMSCRLSDFGLASEEILELFERMDADADAKINREEFLDGYELVQRS